MIKKLTIQNFQSHEFSELEFSENVNVVVGNSDSGKSSIIRALKWLVFHKPSGDEMRSHWGGKTSVELITDDCTVIKSKDKEQEYILGDTHFKAFGTNVPDEITKALNLSDINLQQQLDQSFLLSETPGNVAAHFNKVAKLDKIDTGLQNVNSEIRELTTSIRYEEGQEITLKEQLSAFEHLDRFEIEVEVLEEMDKQYISSMQKETKLETLIQNIKNANSDIDKHSKILEFEKPLDKIFELKDQKKDLEANYADIVSDIYAIKSVTKDIEEQELILELEKPISALLAYYKELKTLNETKTSLFKLLTRTNNIKGLLDMEEAEYMALKAEFEEAMPPGSICPLCNQKIKK